MTVPTMEPCKQFPALQRLARGTAKASGVSGRAAPQHVVADLNISISPSQSKPRMEDVNVISQPVMQTMAETATLTNVRWTVKDIGANGVSSAPNHVEVVSTPTPGL